MKRTLFRAVVAVSAVAALGLLVNAGTLRADDNKDFGKGKPGETVPPQTLPQGFESHRELAADATPSKPPPPSSPPIPPPPRPLPLPPPPPPPPPAPPPPP